MNPEERTREVHHIFLYNKKTKCRTTLGYVHEAKDDKDALRQYRSATKTLPNNLQAEVIQITGMYDIKNSKIIA